MKNKIISSIFVVSVAIILALALFSPAIPKLNSHFIGDGGDNYEYASYMMLFDKNISLGHSPFASTNYWRYPVGFDFSRSFDSHLSITIGGLLNFLIYSPMSYNLTVLILIILNALCSYLYFRYLTHSRSLGFVGMVIYGFSFYTLAKAEAHLNLLFVGGFPLLAYSVLRIIREYKIKWQESFLFFFSLFLISLGSKQYFILALTILISYALIAYIFYEERVISIINKMKDSKGLITVSFVTFLALLAVVFSPYITAIVHGNFYPDNRGNSLAFSTPSILDFFIPNQYLTLLSSFIKNPSIKSIENVVFIGWVELAIFILFFIRKTALRLKIFVLTLFLVPFLLALGYGAQDSFPLLPFRFLKDLFIFKAIAEPGRFFVVFYLIMASIITLALGSIRNNKRLFALIISFTLILLILERLPLRIATVPTLQDSYTKIVQNENTKAVLDIPVNTYYPNYNLLSFYYGKPIVNGYFHWASDGPAEKQFLNSSGLLENYRCNPNDTLKNINSDYLIGNLKANGINTIVIHKDYKFYFTECEGVRIRLSQLIPSVVVASETDKQTQISSKSITGYPKLTLYFPKKGKFNLDGIYAAPDSKASFNIMLNNSPLNVDYSWHSVGSPNGLEILPKDTIEINVEKGSTLSVYSNDLVNSTYLTVWYRYKALDSNSIPYKPAIETIYQNGQVDILRLN